jgi:hypothetical protein
VEEGCANSRMFGLSMSREGVGVKATLARIVAACSVKQVIFETDPEVCGLRPDVE